MYFLSLVLPFLTEVMPFSRYNQGFFTDIPKFSIKNSIIKQSVSTRFCHNSIMVWTDTAGLRTRRPGLDSW
jgi:hypothetical protein